MQPSFAGFTTPSSSPILASYIATSDGIAYTSAPSLWLEARVAKHISGLPQISVW